MPRATRQRPPDPDRLVRRSAGDLRTEDGRFEVSSQGGAGRWYVTDTERHDGLGLALVLGPFATLDAARGAIGAQRSSPAGDDGPLPEPSEPSPPRARPLPSRSGPATTEAPPTAEPEPPEPEPEPAPPPVQVTHARWRRRGDDRDDVVGAVRALHDAWLRGERGSDVLHPSVACLVPATETRAEGPEAVEAAYRGYLSSDSLQAFRAAELTVDLAGATAVVTQRHELVRSEAAGGRTETGRDLLVLTLDHHRWLVTWCAVLPSHDA